MAEPKTEVDRRMDRIEERLEKLESAVNNPDLERLLENIENLIKILRGSETTQ